MSHAVVKSSQPYDIGRQKTIEQYASSHAEVEREDEEEERLSDESDVHVAYVGIFQRVICCLFITVLYQFMLIFKNH
jgi:hypothetical protein